MNNSPNKYEYEWNVLVSNRIAVIIFEQNIIRKINRIKKTGKWNNITLTSYQLYVPYVVVDAVVFDVVKTSGNIHDRNIVIQ